LILSERHLRHKVKEYVRYFNRARPHQGINGRIPMPSSPPPPIIPPLSRLRRIPILVRYHYGYIEKWNQMRYAMKQDCTGLHILPQIRNAVLIVFPASPVTAPRAAQNQSVVFSGAGPERVN
jgi:hypothetical protein